jgi:Reverse transcriptase (RNA-dependent DNA polymerase)/Endonuclease-reverse transcriptase
MSMASKLPPTVVFWNCNGLRKHLTSGVLHALINPAFTPHPPSIIILQETHWTPTIPSKPHTIRHLPPMPGYTWAHRHHRYKSGGMAILYHNSVAFLPMGALDQQCNPITADPTSAATVMWHTVRFPNTPAFLLGSCYIPPTDHDSNTDAALALCAAMTKAISVGLPVLLVGDLNLQHADWMDTSYNLHGHPGPGNALARYISASFLTILNPVLMPGAITRPPAPGSGHPGSVIDLAITNAPLLVSAMNAEHASTLHSDHLPITLIMDLQSHRPPQPTNDRPRRQWSVHRNKEQWQAALPSAMASALTTWPEELLTSPPPAPACPRAATTWFQTTMDTAYSALESTFLSTCERTVGSHHTSSKSKHWMTLPGVKQAYLLMKRTRSISRHSRRPNVVKTRVAEAAMEQWKKTSSQAMSTSWANLCTSLQDAPTSPLRWTALKRSRGSTSSPLGSFPDTQGRAPANIDQSLDNLCSYFTSSSVPPPLPADSYEQDIDTRYLHPRLPSSPLFCTTTLPPHASDDWTFTTEDVQQQCERQHTQSAPGCDTIPPILVRHAGPALYKALSVMFNFSWRHGVLPQQWTEANVMALWKGKGARSQPSSFRPISMTSIIIRTFEHLIHRRLADLLEAASFFHPLQFGFRKNHSTLDAINYLQSNIRAMYPSSIRVPIPTLFLDLQKAFDRVWHPKLMQCIENAGITGRAWLWIHAFLSRRRIRSVQASHISSWQPLRFGVPQGAVLSPLLFNIFINTIAKRIATACPRLNLQLYADDMAIQPRAPPIVNGVRKHPGAVWQVTSKLFDVDLVQAFRLLRNWCDETRMRFGKDKTQWVVFESTKGDFADMDYSRYKQYNLCGFSPEVVEEYKYLGVTHHRQLKWHTQSKEAVLRIRGDSHVVARLIHPPASPHFPAVRLMCLAYIRPRCTYALAFWSAKPQQYRAMQAAFIRPMQRSLGLHTSSHHLGLLVEAHCPSFEALRTQACARFLLRAERLLQSHPQHPTSRALVTDRLAAVTGKTKYHCETRIPVTTRAARDAMPHLINNVLAQLPQLAPRHRLMRRYFPTTMPAGAAAAPPLPTSLSLEEVNSLTMVDTHREWRGKPAYAYIGASTAPLLTIKTSPGQSLFLKVELNPMVSLRARIRANRVHTQYHRHVTLRDSKVVDPSCTFPACRLTLPSFLDTIQHILLSCPRHQLARQQLVDDLAILSPVSTLTLALLSGELPQMPGTKERQRQHGLALLALTATFLTQVVKDREADPTLQPFHYVNTGMPVP